MLSYLDHEPEARMIVPEVIFLVFRQVQPPISEALIPLTVFCLQPNVEDAAHDSAEDE